MKYQTINNGHIGTIMVIIYLENQLCFSTHNKYVERCFYLDWKTTSMLEMRQTYLKKVKQVGAL